MISFSACAHEALRRAAPTRSPPPMIIHPDTDKVFVSVLLSHAAVLIRIWLLFIPEL